MRIISIFLIGCMLLPLFPNNCGAQILINPVYSPVQGNTPAPSGTHGRSSANLMLDVPQPVISDDYKLGQGDRLEAHLIVGDNALVLDHEFVINPEGKIFFPGIGEMALQGLTLKQARNKMGIMIKKKYKEKFELYLMVSEPKLINIYVTGQVAETGLQSVPDGTRMSAILKSVGMAREGSDLSEFVYLKRQAEKGDFQTYKLKLYDVFLGKDSSQDITLKNGDIIAIPTIKSYVYVYGNVSRSGTFGYVSGQTLSDYINIAGGPSPRANLAGVTVTRQENGKPKVFRINASRIIQKGVTDDDIEILPGDVINVPGNFFYFTDFASFANTILLALTLYSAFVK